MTDIELEGKPFGAIEALVWLVRQAEDSARSNRYAFHDPADTIEWKIALVLRAALAAHGES